MKITKSSYSKVTKVDLREIKLSDIFEKNKSGIFKVDESDEQLLYDCLDEVRSIISEKHIFYQMYFKDEGISTFKSL
ncbi:hypothetical protein ACKTJZ_003730 [Clostridioides difficile]|nr:hypothetical protein [Clostridioides difficile]MDV9723751.1 hypothetical protein [Clostridioides difficile]MDV9723772.1 hypothetical protein [Clostridioides difficile]HBF4083031.1 hypothetical protein [Clostridioides difficile]HBG4973711.1 hypothetical protein [Clostridioides difficile]HBH3578164.1 hypothetical protein [Clostridioides difficile]